MKLRDWQAKLRNDSPQVAPAVPALPWAEPAVIGETSDALDGSFEIVLPLDAKRATDEVLKRLARGGYAGMELTVRTDRDVLKDSTLFSYFLAPDDDHPATVLVARIEPRSAEVNGPCVRLKVPPRRPSQMYELQGEWLGSVNDHEIIARFLADLRQFSAWPADCYVKNVIGSVKAKGLMRGEVTTLDGRAQERFEIGATRGLHIKCNAWPFARAELSRFAMEDWLGR